MASAAQSTAAVDALTAWGDANAENGESRRAAAFTALKALIARIADTSNLILDPALDSYYAMDIAVAKAPDLLDSLNSLDRANRALVANPTDAARLAYFAAHGRYTASLAALQASLAAAYDGNKDGSLARGPLADRWAEVMQENTALRRLADEQRIAAWSKERALAGGSAIHDAQARLAVVVDSFWGSTASELDRLLKARASEIRGKAMRDLAIALSTLLVSIFAASWIGRRLTRGMAGLAETTGRLTGGDTDVAVPDTDVRNEFGALARGLDAFRASLIESRRLQAQIEAERAEAQQKAMQAAVDAAKAEAEQLAQIREAEDAAARERERALILDLASRLEASAHEPVARLEAAAQRLQGAVGAMTTLSDVTGREASVATSAANKVQSEMNSVAPAVEEVSASIRSIHDDVQISKDVVARAVDQSSSADQQVEGLNTTAQRIGEIVSLIDAIASQTNLLALNATIEAARAGEAGRGFAVVASEVKSLATQTAQATQQISEQVAAIQDSTRAAVAAIRGIHRNIEEVSSVSASIASSVGQQSNAMLHISENVCRTLAGVEDAAAAINTVSQATDDAKPLASDVAAASADVQSQALTVRRQIENFVASLRMAHAA